ncbi:MAG TPA: TrmH family RNA methyltransferase [Patescibacteria group bacterium]|nr:TrmH family RNA methyltransferase [Patescibacteria group bacterium]
MIKIILLAHNVRSCHNVGSLLRTAEGLGLEKVYLSGYTPYPKFQNDKRLPHLAEKINKQIHKTALGAEKLVNWEQADNPVDVIVKLKSQGYEICGLEQNDKSINLSGFRPQNKIVLVVGNEITGLDPDLMAKCSKLLEIPMFGKKESFNVVQAAAMALYHLRFLDSA